MKTLRDKRREQEQAKPKDAKARLELPVLFASDFHLGEHSKDLQRIEYLKKIRTYDREFCDFLEYHEENRLEGKAWRLVIAGDFLDFIAVTFMPAQDEDSIEVLEDEERFGLDNSEQKCVWKLDHIIARHRELFTYLADFVARGHHLEMLYGNHDVEFYWPQVQERFVEALIEIYFGGERVVGAKPADFRHRVHFHQWFLYEPGHFYIEHGNQYDDFSSFEQRLHPLMPYDKRYIAMPISHLAIRYFVNQYEGFRSHDKDNWTLGDYVRWLRQQGVQNVLKIANLYVILAAKVWGYSNAIRSAPLSEENKAQHRQLIEENAARYAMSAEVGQKINDHRNRPIETRLGPTMQLLSFDKYMLGLSLASLLLLVLVGGVAVDLFSGFGNHLLASSAFRLLILVGVLGLGAAGWFGLDRVLATLSGGKLSTSVHPKLERAAGKLAGFVDARYILMGHSHHATLKKVRHSPERFYVNTGCWIVPERRERHDPHCRSPLTFARYDWDQGELELFRWCTRDNQPVVYVEAHGTETEGSETLRERLQQIDSASLLQALEQNYGEAEDQEEARAESQPNKPKSQRKTLLRSRPKSKLRRRS